jgi:Methyltransferase domain
VNDTRNIGERIEQLDLDLFGFVEAQLNDSDKQSLLALHAGCRRTYGTYAYLEIGSHLGGSLQTVVRDPACTRAISIDPRPAAQPDEHKGTVRYGANSTERMLDRLRAVPDSDLTKLETIEATTGTIDPATVAVTPAFCFVDGEHTDSAVLQDARFCRCAIEPTGVIAFHDMSTVYRGLHAFMRELERDRVEFHAAFLSHSIFVFELGPPRVLASPQVADALQRAGPRVLLALMDVDPYRRAHERRRLRRLRRFLMRG